MHELGDPRIMDLMGVENPLWHTISADIVGPWNVSQFQGERGRNSRFKLHDVIKVLATFTANKRLPQNVVTTQAPS